MTVQYVLVCEDGGCRKQSGAHSSEEMLRMFEPLVNSWGRYNPREWYTLNGFEFDEGATEGFKDLCPRCVAEHFFQWLFQFFGGEQFGCVFAIRPQTEEFKVWYERYDPSEYEFQAGRECSVKYGHGTTDFDVKHNRPLNILPTFIFGSKEAA